MSQDHTRLPPTRGEGQGRRARPILFSGPMVRALLAGSKTQTRRIVKAAPSEPEAEAVMVHGELCFGVRGNPGTTRETFNFTHGEEGERSSIRCPYGVPGDLLWVKERLAHAPHLWTYVADGSEVGYPARRDLASKRLDYAPSIHMPKVASRLTLEITEVRVERLQDISEADALAEGIQKWPDGRFAEDAYDPDPNRLAARSAVGGYEVLWIDINGPESWAANPWVWAVSFKVHQQNVAALSQPHPPGGNSHEG